MNSFFETFGVGPALWIGFGLLFAACGSDPVEPVGLDVYVEVQVSGGLAGVDYSFAVDGAALEVRGLTCGSGCDFESGDVLARLTRAQVLDYSARLREAGILANDGRNYGDQCCDQFYYAVEYREGNREAVVRGAMGALPSKLADVVADLHALVYGIVPILVDFDSRPEDWPRDALALVSHSLEGGILTLELEFGGGCAEHELGLVAWGGWLESFPVQVNVLLSHEDFDDPCDALVRPTLRFDLTPLSAEYTAVYGKGGSGSTTILLRLTVPDGNPPRLLEYTIYE